MARLIDPGRALSFVLLMFGGGLLQLWVLIIHQSINGHSIALPIILSDGGLYFFSTSLVFSSFLSLLNHEPLRFGEAPFNVSFICISLVVLTAVVTYVDVRTDMFHGAEMEFSENIVAQMACVSIAAAYAVFVLTKIGFLR